MHLHRTIVRPQAKCDPQNEATLLSTRISALVAKAVAKELLTSHTYFPTRVIVRVRISRYICPIDETDVILAVIDLGIDQQSGQVCKQHGARRQSWQRVEQTHDCWSGNSLVFNICTKSRFLKLCKSAKNSDAKLFHLPEGVIMAASKTLLLLFLLGVLFGRGKTSEFICMIACITMNQYPSVWTIRYTLHSGPWLMNRDGHCVFVLARFFHCR